MISKLSHSLVVWYKKNRRSLPWRETRNPYSIWISEVMLQQTTVQAVVPYFERFMKRFPTLQDLAAASEEQVLESWSGLGYYSRAKNLYKASQKLSLRFPKTAAELLLLPGFGPYTSRAVSSLSFGEAVGVLDGNVIRVLSRVTGNALQWWKTKDRQVFQNISDEMALAEDPYYLNQALMELGATVCTPTNPACVLCPWSNECEALKKNTIVVLPLKRPRKKIEYWFWHPELLINENQIALVKNNYAPFLKGQWLPPGKIFQMTQKPKAKEYQVRHSITHHNIFVKIKKSSVKKLANHDLQWVELKDLKKINPSSLLQKIIKNLS